MWSTEYLVFCISVLYLDKIVFSLKINMTEFRQVDSDFDLVEAIENFRPEDFDTGNIKGIGHLESKVFKYNYNPRRKLPNRTSEENRKLIEDAYSLIDTSGERERQQILHSLEKKEDLGLEDMRGKIQNNAKGYEGSKGKRRVKRNGEGKFAEAAKVSNLKMLRIYLAMFSNLWSDSYIGGAHPMHKDVPKSVMILFKHRIMEFFFPPVGESKV